jgi:hypothetical protein
MAGAHDPPGMLSGNQTPCQFDEAPLRVCWEMRKNAQAEDGRLQGTIHCRKNIQAFKTA